ncbi:MAG: type II toxin-antitoxin system Phd/YefM family antitoxin [Angelakisella sp.]|nr:type II toxin-antitoxin system Phd/YefM family antitoxin [Angelakisella sp.]MCI9666048.1 type II toxin-antitoxin system Phd/YefM family antitoxin [Angelakisella sp.]
MMIDTRSIVSITEANQNFSKVARLVDQLGTAVIMKNNVPRYIVTEFSQAEAQESLPDELVDSLSEKYLEKNKELYEALAK